MDNTKFAIVLLIVITILSSCQTKTPMQKETNQKDVYKEIKPCLPYEKKQMSTELSAFDVRDYDVTFKYPSNWSPTFYLGEVHFFDKGVPILAVSQGKITSDTLQEVTSLEIEFLEKYSDIELTELCSTMLDSIPANRATYTDVGEWVSKNVIIWAVKDNKAYRISFSPKQEEFNQYEDIFNAVVESFEVKQI